MLRRSTFLILVSALASSSLLVVGACGGGVDEPAGAGPSSESSKDQAATPGPCGETPGHTPGKSEGEPCTQAGLVCGPFRCSGRAFHRIERCLTSPDQVGKECRVTPGYPCVLRDHCDSDIPTHGVPYRGYSCIDGRWKDITGIPCPDAGDAATE